jgi:hypothetical protein
VIDPERVLRMAYLPGEKVRVELGFRREGEVSAVSGHFRRFVGSRYSARHLEPGISLVGKLPDSGSRLGSGVREPPPQHKRGRRPAGPSSEGGGKAVRG